MNARLSDITLWGFVTASAWTFGGIFCAIIFYENINRVPMMQPTPEHMQLLVRILLPWAVIGFIVGVFGLFKFLYLAEVLIPVRAYPVHVVQMSVASLIVAGLLGWILYPLFAPPQIWH
jgi:hypothetical protein